MELEHKITLLALLKKDADEGIDEVLKMLVNTGSFTKKEGKAIIKELRSQGLVDEVGLTFVGTAKAKEAEAEFKL